MHEMEYRTNYHDLMIGNFMKTQCFGYKPSIYNPDFGRTLTKYSDNGGVKSKDEYNQYIKYYTNKIPNTSSYISLPILDFWKSSIIRSALII